MTSSIRDQIVRVQCVDSSILISHFKINTKKCINRHFLSCNAKNVSEIQQFIDQQLPSKICVTHTKAIVFSFIESEFSCFIDAYKFHLKCREFCQSHGIYAYFPNEHTLQAFSCLSNTKILLQNGQKVTVIYLVEDFSSLTGTTLIRKQNQYEINKFHTSKNIEFTQKWKDEFMKNEKPSKVILVRQKIEDFDAKIGKLKDLFKTKNCIVLSQLNHEIFERSIVDKVLHVMGEKASEYEVTNINQNYFGVWTDSGVVFTAVFGDCLPFEETNILKVDEENIIMLFARFKTATHSQEVLHCYKLYTPEKHEVKVTLKIDENAFYEFKVETIDPKWNDKLKDCIDVFNGKNINEELNEIQLKNKASKEKPSKFSKVRMIFDKQNFIVTVGDGKKMEVLKDVDGNEKIPIYISFGEKKPKFGNIAKEFYKTKPKFVVFDLIKLCSISNADVMSPKWGLKLEKEDEAIMVAMDTVEGEKYSSVEFLLALILKHGLHLAKTKIEKKIDEIEIGFDGFVPNEILKKNFVEAGKLKKVGIKFC